MTAMFKLPKEVIIGNIFPFLSKEESICLLGSSSKYLHDLFYSDLSIELWNAYSNGKPTQVCIDGYCPTCRFILKATHSPETIMRCIRKVPIKSIKIHCFLKDIPLCLEALSHRKSTLTSLELNFTNISESPPLDAILNSSFMEIYSESFTNLVDLSMDSSHLTHVNLSGRSKLLDLLGRNLQKLSFCKLSPSGIFSILSSKCPRLERLRVDKASSLADFCSYQSVNLLELHLHRSLILPPASISHQFPSLRKFSFSSANRFDAAQVLHAVENVPLSLQELEMEVPGSLVGLFLAVVARRLAALTYLSVQGSHEAGEISTADMRKIASGCPLLSKLRVACTLSVNPLFISGEEAFSVLCGMENLKTLELSTFKGKWSWNRVLSVPHSLEEITFIPEAFRSVDESLVRYVAHLTKEFPHIRWSIEAIQLI